MGFVTPKLTAVIAAYNRPREFKLCLEGFRRQSFLINHHQEFELIVADDGSDSEIEEIFSNFSDRVSFPTTYVRKEHAGWGKLRMLNWATLEAQAERIVFTDADCIPHRHFLKSHDEARLKDVVLGGRRVDIMEKLAGALTLEDVRSGKLESYAWLIQNIVQGKMDYGGQGFYLAGALAKTFSFFSTNSQPTLLGSNFSIQKKRLLELNGFDETFAKPGYGEDVDLERRLKLAGAGIEWITYRAIQFHLWHPLTPVGEESKQTFEEVKRKGTKRALKGIEEFLPEYQKITGSRKSEPRPV